MLPRFVYTLLFVVPLTFGQRVPPNSETTLDKGIEEFHQGQYLDAKQDFEKAVHLSPADSRAITYLALTAAALGACPAQSIDELKLQLYRNPDLEIRRLSGLAVIRCLLPFNQVSDLMPLLVQLRQLYPDDPDVLYESIQVYNRAFNLTVRELQQKAPSSYRTNQLAAEVLETQGHYPEAAAEYRKAIEKAPRVVHLHYGLGRSLLAASHEPASLDSARQAFEAELKINPANAAAEYQMGQVLLASKKTGEAAEHLEKALDLAPRCAECLIELARLKIEAQSFKDAVPLLERAIELQPALEAAHYNLMLAYRGTGKNKQADREQAEVNRLRHSAGH